MMRFFLYAFCAVVGVAAYAQRSFADNTLLVKITNIKMDDKQKAVGKIYVCLYSSKAGSNPEFPSCEIDGVKKIVAAKVGSGSAEVSFSNLKPGKYALSAFQDTDGDARLATTLGIPTERVGTYKSAIVRPDFDEIAFDVPSKPVEIKLLGF